MVSAGINILDSSLRSQLFAIQKTQRAVDTAQLRLASGRRVNTALDNPQSYFAASGLDNRASDLNHLLDSIGQSLQTIELASNALKATETLLSQSQGIADELLISLKQGQDKTLNDLILENNPVGYWRLNEDSGLTATNLGSGGAAIDGTYPASIQLGEDQIYLGENSEATALFSGSGTNNYVSIPDSNLINLGSHDERSIELVFNANTVRNRQVLYEEGGGNSLVIYIEDEKLYVNGKGIGWGPFDIHADIEAGKTYHVALVFDSPNGTLTGYLNSEFMGQGTVTSTLPNHTGDIGIGGLNGSATFHDGIQGGSGLTFDGRIGEVALYNSVLSEADIQERYDATLIQKSNDTAEQLNIILDQLDALVLDSGYRGTNLLNGDDLLTVFNEDRSSSLLIEGDVLDSAGLGLTKYKGFYKLDYLESSQDDIRDALSQVRNFTASLASDFTVIKTREQYTKSLINTLHEGVSKLTLADQNEEGAKLLALQVRQQIQFSALQFSSQRLTIADFLA